jgi:hypothetical protein
VYIFLIHEQTISKNDATCSRSATLGWRGLDISPRKNNEQPIPVAAWPPPAWWDYGFESRRGHGCLSLVHVVSYQIELSAKGRSIVQRSPTVCVCVCVCVYVSPCV